MVYSIRVNASRATITKEEMHYILSAGYTPVRAKDLEKGDKWDRKIRESMRGWRDVNKHYRCKQLQRVFRLDLKEPLEIDTYLYFSGSGRIREYKIQRYSPIFRIYYIVQSEQRAISLNTIKKYIYYAVYVCIDNDSPYEVCTGDLCAIPSNIHKVPLTLPIHEISEKMDSHYEVDPTIF
jgi:hypothetical protein